MGEKLNLEYVYFETDNGYKKLGGNVMDVGLETIFDIDMPEEGDTEF